MERFREARLYEDLRRTARSLCQRERLLITLQPTALVHEAILRIRQTGKPPATLTEYLRLARTVMQHILIDRIRRRRAERRGGDCVRVHLTEDLAPVSPMDGNLRSLLDGLARAHPRRARVVELRTNGFDVPETARILNISERTVKSDWAEARVWLADRL